MCDFSINEFAEIFGYMLGDGWLSFSRKVLTGGFSGDEESMYFLKRKLLDMFGDIGKATVFTEHTSSPKYEIEGTTSKFNINTKTAHIFKSYGMPIGQRVEQDYSIPEWILNGDRQIKIMFLSGIYAAEGWMPAFQRRDKMMKTLGFSFYKRKRLGIDVRDNLTNNFKSIFDDLGIEYNIKIASIFTKDDNWEVRFVFKNNHVNTLKVLNMLELNYCRRKKISFSQVASYYKLKDDLYKHLWVAYEEALSDRKTSARKIGLKYGITQSQVESWRSRQTGIKITAKFPTFTQFLNDDYSDILFTLNSVKQGKS